jgi:lipocalin
MHKSSSIIISFMLAPANEIILDKYKGKWFEIASFPAWFARGCKKTTAEYTIKPNSAKVQVLNTCEVNGKQRKARGSAKTSSMPNVLKVGFPPFEFLRADYIIEFVDNMFQHAVVGSSSKRYLWILAREPIIDDEIYSFLVDQARKKGYDTSRLVKTPQ